MSAAVKFAEGCGRGGVTTEKHPPEVCRIIETGFVQNNFDRHSGFQQQFRGGFDPEPVEHGRKGFVEVQVKKPPEILRIAVKLIRRNVERKFLVEVQLDQLSGIVYQPGQCPGGVTMNHSAG